MAAAVHGVVRASLDADLVISLAVREAARIKDVFVAAGFAVELRKGDFDDPIQATIELKDEFENRVDLLIGIKGMERETFDRSLEVTFYGERLRVVGLEDFAMKLFAGGPQDLSDAKHILALNTEALDVAALREITRKYGTDASAHLESLLN